MKIPGDWNDRDFVLAALGALFIYQDHPDQDDIVRAREYLGYLADRLLVTQGYGFTKEVKIYLPLSRYLLLPVFEKMHKESVGLTLDQEMTLVRLFNEFLFDLAGLGQKEKQ